jgi:hypothetical protein
VGTKEVDSLYKINKITINTEVPHLPSMKRRMPIMITPTQPPPSRGRGVVGAPLKGIDVKLTASLVDEITCHYWGSPVKPLPLEAGSPCGRGGWVGVIYYDDSFGSGRIYHLRCLVCAMTSLEKGEIGEVTATIYLEIYRRFVRANP